MSRRSQGLSFLAGLGCFLFAAAAFAAGPPITDYIVYGENGAKLGAGSSVTGLMGARNNFFQGNAVFLNGGASVTGDVRSGGNVGLGNGVTITGIVHYDSGTSTVTVPPSSSVGGLDGSGPQLPALPPASVFPCPSLGPNDSGANGQSRSINQGTYGNYTFGAGFTLTLLDSGNYYFNSISTANGAKIIVNAAPVHIYVC